MFQRLGKIVFCFERVRLNARMQRPCFIRSASYKASDGKSLSFPVSKSSVMEGLQRRDEVKAHTAIAEGLCNGGEDWRLNKYCREVVKGIEKGSVSFKMWHLFEALREKKLIQAVDGLIKACADAGRFEEAVSEIIIEREGGVSTETCNFVMKKLVEGDEMSMVEFAYTELKKKGLIPNVYTYGILIEGRCKDARSKEAWDLITQMREAGVEPDAFIYSTYIHGLCWLGKPDLAYEELKKNMWEVDESAYSCLIRGFAQEWKLQDAEDVLNDMKLRELVPDSDCYRALLGGYCDEGDFANAEDVYDEMQSRGIKTDSVIVNQMMQWLCESGMVEEALFVFKYLMLPSEGVSLDRVSFGIAIHAACAIGKMDEALWFVEEMKDRKMEVNAMNYGALMYGYGLHGELVDSMRIFYEMEMKGVPTDADSFPGLGDASKYLDFRRIKFKL